MPFFCHSHEGGNPVNRTKFEHELDPRLLGDDNFVIQSQWENRAWLIIKKVGPTRDAKGQDKEFKIRESTRAR